MGLIQFSLDVSYLTNVTIRKQHQWYGSMERKALKPHHPKAHSWAINHQWSLMNHAMKYLNRFLILNKKTNS